MIAKLAGLLDQVTSDGAVIDVGGVGYLVFCSTRTTTPLPPPGGPARLLIETHVREDHIHLYGFIDAVERDWFRLLTTVQGVGARLALALLSALSPDQLALAILSQDKATLARADGVGPRLAARIANELRDKVGGLATAAATVTASPAAIGKEAGAAARRSIMCCSSARPGWARRRWRRSSPANWRSASAPPRGRSSSAPAISPRC